MSVIQTTLPSFLSSPGMDAIIIKSLTEHHYILTNRNTENTVVFLTLILSNLFSGIHKLLSLSAIVRKLSA